MLISAPPHERGEPKLSDPKALYELKALGVHAKHLERPSTEREAQQILARAARDGMTVLPVGGATAMGAGVLPESVDLLFDTIGLAKILAFDPRNLNLAVLAGMTLGAINEHLAKQERGFFLPLDPPLSHRATIGGIYAANLSGPSRLRYGTLRDQALGVRGVDARGREVGFGGKTVKNVSGYDLTRFFIGSAGSLCLVTSLSLRVYPLPEASSLCALSFENLEGLEKFLSALRTSVLIPSAVLASDSPAGAAPPAQTDPSFRVLISFEGHPQAVDRQNRDTLSLARQFGGTGQAFSGRESLTVNFRSVLDPDESMEDRLVLKVTVPIAAGPRTLEALRNATQGAGIPCQRALLAGNGAILLNASGSNREAAASLLQRVKEIARAAGGYATPIRAHRHLLAGWGPRVDPVWHQFILQPLKKSLDPAGLFPPVL
jgi:glycolate oxidase FAD binding subunit